MKKEQCASGGNIVAIYFIDPKDTITFPDGTWRMKRKYGKFKREVYKVDTKVKTP